jgi:DNA-binding transcriptional ArsR family regulator
MQTPVTDPFGAIADPSRRQMLRLLSRESLTINALAENFEMSRPAVSKHLKILSHAGFISIETVGRERHCSLKPDGFKQMQEWMAFFDKFWNTKLAKLQSLLNQKPKK